MELKKLVDLAAKVYILSNGTMKTIEMLKKTNEMNLSQAILNLENKIDSGSFTRNLVDILIYAVKVTKDAIDPQAAIHEIQKLKQTGLLQTQTVSWFNVISRSPDIKCESEYVVFVEAVCAYIQNMKKLADEKKQESLLLNKIKVLEEALLEKNKLLEEKEAEFFQIKTKYVKVIHPQSEEISKISIECLLMELKFEKSYSDVSKFFDTHYKDLEEDYREIYNKLSKFFSTYLRESKEFKLDNADLKLKISQLTEKCNFKKSNQVLAGHSTLFFMPHLKENSPASQFCSWANKMLNFISSPDFQKLPKDISSRDFENYMAGAKLCMQQNEAKPQTYLPLSVFPWSLALR